MPSTIDSVHELVDPITGRPAPRGGVSAAKKVLHHQVPDDGMTYWAARAGDSALTPGTVLSPGMTVGAHQPVWFFPPLAPEEPIPFHYQVLARTPELVVVDKPHFLPTTSNGRLVVNTVQTRARVEENNPELVPLHRLDRLTAGAVALARNPEQRGRYQQLFAQHQVRKTYLATVSRHLPLPVDVATPVELWLKKNKGSRQVHVGAPGTGSRTLTYVTPLSEQALKKAASTESINAPAGGSLYVTLRDDTSCQTNHEPQHEQCVQLQSDSLQRTRLVSDPDQPLLTPTIKPTIAITADSAGASTTPFPMNQVPATAQVVMLQPVTGFTHQLRVVCHHLQSPILGDDTYPEARTLDLYDFATPLQLVAAQLRFTDPVTGDNLCFTSRHGVVAPPTLLLSSSHNFMGSPAAR